jgi:hypothetical protein
MEKLHTVRKLIEKLNVSGIRYCHWKSNIALAESLSGQTDIDLLIDRKDANLFRTILYELCFQPAMTTDGDPFPSVEHYYALDEESGTLVHVHAYFEVITGESLTKNYHFPIEEMLLDNTRVEDSVLVPQKSAELIVFTLRMMLKHTSLIELILLARYWKKVKDEINWLMESDTIDETLGFIRCYLPSIDPQLFLDCVAALKKPASLYQRVILGHQLRSQIRIYARYSTLKARLDGIRKFAVMFFRRFARSHKSMSLRSGGAIIAFVGSEATGKSTLVAEMRGWLGEHFAVQEFHVGKPKPSLLTFIPGMFLPALRSLFPHARSTKVEAEYRERDHSESMQPDYPMLFAIRSVLLAYDRKSLLSRAFSQVANGTIILCDRYPSLNNGAPDSPQLSCLTNSTGRYSIRRWLANTEAMLYRGIPKPDLVIYLTAPIEVTISRNAVRSKYEPEDYVRRRHARSSGLEFGKTPVHKINTDQPFERTLLEVKQAIWSVLRVIPAD